MQTHNKQKNDISQESLGLRIWINFCWILLNTVVLIFLTAVLIFMVASRLIIIILWPIVRFSLILETLNLKLKNVIIKERLKILEEERDNED
jgi:hypothetical protein